ncbi:hypothetical protein GCM10010329_04670 [Streptomyces spiroverticillatus]|uniref:Extensin n=1 Tax=Streptomyces finlayi TaxID=67296 RepID=A0A918WSL4_9ACTN|nr:hypothetical protein [Streptomyces finlayi]GGZ87736.1 hypothetical protein GCM10010329_04670 [Streptomyces spiroverticillatus]GHC78899.1 hypothetical protein GCM10010334_04650 [Streptomyces finlayi]
MADERYEWLDEAAAERLLRGEPDENAGPSGGGALGVGSSGDGAVPFGTDAEGAAAAAAGASGEAVSGAGLSRAGADSSRVGEVEVAAALDGLRAAADGGTASGHGSGTGSGSAAGSGVRELPGEAAALAAFRQSRCVASARRRSRWGRPLRLGLVTVVAAGALGGVAVAAGTGVLPGPFLFGHVEPDPASSVSVASPDSAEHEVDPESTEGPQPERSGPPEKPTGGSPPPATGGESSGGSRVSGGTTGDDRDGSADPGGGSKGTDQDTGSGASTTDPSKGREPDSSQGSGDKEGQGKGWQQRTVKACRDYRANRLPDQVKQYLEAQAKGADGIARFCDRLLDGKGGDNGAVPPLPGDDGNQGPGSGNGTGSGGGTGGKGENDDHVNDDGGRGNGSRGGKGNHRTDAKALKRAPARALTPARRTAFTPSGKLPSSQV